MRKETKSETAKYNKMYFFKEYSVLNILYNNVVAVTMIRN